MASLKQYSLTKYISYAFPGLWEKFCGIHRQHCVVVDACPKLSHFIQNTLNLIKCLNMWSVKSVEIQIGSAYLCLVCFPLATCTLAR